MIFDKEGRYTYADLLKPDAPELYDLIDGVLTLTYARSLCHQTVLGGLTVQIANYLVGKKPEVYFGPLDVRLFEKPGDKPETVDTVVQPDILLVCDPTQFDEQGCIGAPDMIAEVVSNDSVKMDYLEKAHLYQRAGVKEYWIVEPEGKRVLVHQLIDGRYELTNACGEDGIARVNVLDNCFVDLSRVFVE